MKDIMVRPLKNARRGSWAPLRFSLVIALLLCSASILLYPGGTASDASSRGYSFAHNFLPSTVIFHPAGQVHSDHFLDAGARTFNVELNAQWMDRLQAYPDILDAPAYFEGGRPTALAARLYQETAQTDAASGLVMEALILEILAETARRAVPVIERMPPRWLQQARDLLHEEFATSPTLGEIASVVGVHPVYLSSTFRQQFGCTIGDYLRRLRIDDACRRLVPSKLPLAAIALEAGFANQSHFTRTFKRLTGLTPSEYRPTFRS